MEQIQKYPESVQEISYLLLKAQQGSFEDELIPIDSTNQIIRSIETKPLINDVNEHHNENNNLNSDLLLIEQGFNNKINSEFETNKLNNTNDFMNSQTKCENVPLTDKKNIQNTLCRVISIDDNCENSFYLQLNNVNVAFRGSQDEITKECGNTALAQVNNKLKNESGTETTTTKEVYKQQNNNSPCLYQHTHRPDLHTHELSLEQRIDTDTKIASQHLFETREEVTLLPSSSSTCFPPSQPVTSHNVSSSCAQSRNIFKKSHTCGSLYAKCSCDDNDSSTGSSRKNSLHQEQNSDVNSVENNYSASNVTENIGYVERRKIYENSKRSNSLDSRSNIRLRDNYSSDHKFRIIKFEELQKAYAKNLRSSVEENDLRKDKTSNNEKKNSDSKEEKLVNSSNRKKSQESRQYNYPYEQEVQSENKLVYPTLGNIYSDICSNNPGICLKHPEIPYPIPPISYQSIKKSDEQPKIFKVVNFPNKPNNEPKDINRNTDNENYSREYKHITDAKHPVNLTQVLQAPNYIPDFPECRKNIEYPRNFVAANCFSSYNWDPAEEFYEKSGILGPMGNGVSTTIRKNSKVNQDAIRKNSKILADNINKRHSSGVPDDYDYLKQVVPHLKKELGEWEQKAGNLEADVLQLKRDLQNKESEIVKLRREVHKLKSVLQQTTSTNHEGDLLASLQERHGMANRASKLYKSATINKTITGNEKVEKGKKQGVSAESSDSSNQQASDIQITRYDKDFRSKQLIKDAIMDNDFLKNLDSSQVREIVDSMYQREYRAGSYVIREGEAGAHLFVSAEGEFEVIKDNVVLGRMGPGKAFGELAILYNCTRTASIRVDADSKVWVLDRKVFQQIMMRTGLQRLQDNINFLRSVPLLTNLSNEVLAKIADVLEVEFYPADAYIIRQGASGDTFFIISSGCVKVTQRIGVGVTEQNIRTLSRGDYFGEQALLKEDCRTASVVALHPGVECLTLDRDSFIQLIGDLSELQEKDYGDEQRALSRPNSTVNVSDNVQEFDHIKLNDLDVIATLGVGGFGRVELVQYAYDRTQTFALKCLKKQHIVDTQQQEHVFSEKKIMMSCRSPFICRLYKTFRDNKYVYMLLEACLGGEVWTILRDRGCFDDHTTRFITACVVEAFTYLHSKGIIYRDLKPENLLLDSRGYVKMVDFGFSKRLGYSSKTWTFCGTPEYVAPETILNKGHDRAVDYWALGILMHELLTGTPPFTAADPMKTYNIILKGIDMVIFPRYVTRTAQSLIKKLCRDVPSERLGCQRGGIQDIKKHKWFQGFDWDGLHNLTMTPPLAQPVRGPTDTSNFDCYAKDSDIPPDELTNWDLEF